MQRVPSTEKAGRSTDATIVVCDEWEFHPLKGGEQFLLSRIHPGEGIWFGGTDERPFLVQLKLEALDHFEADGEAGFFEALKPEVIQNHEQEWGVDRTKRQGDIFAYPLPWSWWQFLRNNWVEGQEVKLAETSVAAFGTRHRFTGKIANVGRQTSIVEGILEAPDHSPLRLKGPHVLAHARFISDPPNAD